MSRAPFPPWLVTALAVCVSVTAAEPAKPDAGSETGRASNGASVVAVPTSPTAGNLELLDLSSYRTVETAIPAKLDKISSAKVAPTRLAGYLGIRLRGSTGEDTGRPMIAEVEANSPAARAGLSAGDQLLSIDGEATRDVLAARDRLRGRLAGDKLSLVVLQETRLQLVELELAPRSRPLSIASGVRGIMGVQVEDADGGARVARLSSGFPAEKAGVKVGDLIVEIDGSPVDGAERLTDTLTGRKPGEVVKIKIQRAGQVQDLSVTLAADRGGPDLSRTLRDMQQRAMTAGRIFTKPVYKLAVIGLEFPDVKANPKITPAEWERALFSRGEFLTVNATGQDVYGSVNDYYIEQSCGKLRLEGRVFPYVTVKRKRAEYGLDANRFALLAEALDALLARDGPRALDSYDGLFFLYAGPRQAAQRGGLYWPHRAMMTHKGRRWDYFICPEGGQRMESISVIAHEFGHMLGLPDLYARPEVPDSEGLGVWCTMATGHGRDGKPLHFSAYCKMRMNWLTPKTIDPRTPQKLLLSPIEDSSSECYRVLIQPDESEYLLLENRRRRGFDRDLPGEGLLIWRVVDGRPVLEESHGIPGAPGPEVHRQSVPYPTPSNNAFTPDTVPSSKPVKSGGFPVHITNIQKLPDGRIAFQIGYEYQ